MDAEDTTLSSHRRIRWNGWGDPARSTALPKAVRVLLPLLVGKIRRSESAVCLKDVRITPSTLTDEDRLELENVVGQENVLLSDEARIVYSRGRSTIDLLRRREVEQDAVDVVVSPATHEEVQACLDVAAQLDFAVIPIAGGTSVVGALDPERGSKRGVISLDLSRLSGLLAFDEVSAEATFAAGTTGPNAEAALGELGFELGHYPQSFLYATLGGFAAARSSGQNSAGYGRFDTMVTGLRVATPTGEIDLGRSPGSAAGPDLIRVFLGSEGIFGVITEVRVKVHPKPTQRIVEAWSFPSFTAGAEALRKVAQHQGSGPTVIRLSDEAESAISLAQVKNLGRVFGKAGSANAVTVYEGEDLEARRKRISAILKAEGGKSTGNKDAADWQEGRFEGPYLRDGLLDAGAFCETLETGTKWSNLATLRTAVEETLKREFALARLNVYVMCHISHIYPTGASLYFTVVSGSHPDRLAMWKGIKAKVNDAIIQNGGTISHHHAVGRDHAPWLAEEIGETGIRILRAIKRELDPHMILNPGAVIVENQRQGDDHG